MSKNLLKTRENMIFGQLKPQGIRDAALIDALTQLPREDFLPASSCALAYLDQKAPLGNAGRALMPVFMLARLIEAASLSKTDVVLDIGCATGYSTTVLAYLAGKVIGLECDRALAQSGVGLLGRFGIENAVIAQQNDLRLGYAARAPYDVILLNGSVSIIPEHLCQQLADGGRLIAAVSTQQHTGRVVRVTRHGDSFVTQSLFDAAIPMLPASEHEKRFNF